MLISLEKKSDIRDNQYSDFKLSVNMFCRYCYNPREVEKRLHIPYVNSYPNCVSGKFGEFPPRKQR